jgi:hypothetical protein
MDALLSLEPRELGTEVMEPIADFGGGEDALHERNRCIYTLCENHTLVCLGTFFNN